MQIYLRDFVLYSFDWQKAFEAIYIAGNSAVSQEQQKHKERNLKHRGNALTKG